MNEKLENFKKRFCGESADLIGAGVSNIAAARFLRQCGMTVRLRDRSDITASTLADMDEIGVKCIYGKRYLDDIDAPIVLRSPGIRPDIPELATARENGSLVTTEIGLFCMLCNCRVIAVTGSDGKTTTSTVIYEMLRRHGLNVFLGGNIGTPPIGKLNDLGDGDYAVLEMSSFQLMDCDISPWRAVVTNVTPNHLDWHTSMDEYISAKSNIFRSLPDDGTAILSLDNDVTSEYAKSCKNMTFSTEKNADIRLVDDCIVFRGKRVLNVGDISVRGLYNVRNYMAAVGAVGDVVNVEDIRDVAVNFRGVRHRAEIVYSDGGIDCIDSSIDTTPSRTIATLDSFDRPVILIVGGYDKLAPIDPLVPVLKKHTKYICCTGDNGKRIYDMMLESAYDEANIIYIAQFDDAVANAVDAASCDDIILLSPAAASFDRFRNYEQRGDRFAAVVKEKLGLRLKGH